MQDRVLCRICLFSHDENRTRNIFTKWQPPWLTPDDTDGAPTIAERIAELAQTEINVNDPYPPVVCVSCFHQFQKMCLFLHRVCLSDRLMRKRCQLFEADANQMGNKDICEDATFTITSVLQLSNAQYDNLESINKLTTNDEESNLYETQTSDITNEVRDTEKEINSECSPVNAEHKTSDETNDKLASSNAENETTDNATIENSELFAHNSTGVEKAISAVDTETIQNSNCEKVTIQDDTNIIELVSEKANNDSEITQNKVVETAVGHDSNEIKMVEHETNEIDLITGQKNDCEMIVDGLNHTELIQNKQNESFVIQDNFNDNELLQEVQDSNEVNPIQLHSISDRLEPNVRSSDFRNDIEMLQFLEGYNSEWIDCKDVFTSTDDLAEYLGIKLEHDEYGMQIGHERLVNGYHSEVTLDENQIKIEPVSEDEEMLMDGSRRLCDRDASPFMETEWLEDFKTDPSDSEMSANVPQECMLCSRRFQTMNGLKTHVISSHSYRTVFRMSVDSNMISAEMNNLNDGQDPSEKWCQYCNITVSNLARHLYEVKHTIKRCSWCDSTFANDRLLFVHSQKCIRRHRNLNGRSLISNTSKPLDQMRIACIGSIASPPMEISAQYKCQYCSESFVNSEYLNIHVQAYHTPSIQDDGGDDMEALQMEVNQGGAT